MKAIDYIPTVLLTIPTLFQIICIRYRIKVKIYSILTFISKRILRIFQKKKLTKIVPGLLQEDQQSQCTIKLAPLTYLFREGRRDGDARRCPRAGRIAADFGGGRRRRR